MYMDGQNLFTTNVGGQVVTSTAISTNVIDLGATPTLRDIGIGSPPLYLVVQTAVTCTDASSDATLAITLESDSTENLATSATVHFSTGAMAFATYATAGSVLACTPLPSGNYERYLGVRFTVASGPLTAGAFDAFLTTEPDRWRAYPDNVSIA